MYALWDSITLSGTQRASSDVCGTEVRGMAERSTRLLLAIAVSPFVILGLFFLSIQLSLINEKMSALASVTAFVAGALLYFASKILHRLRSKMTPQASSAMPPVVLAFFRAGYTLMLLAVLNSIGLYASTHYV
jgi:hypothetical protein